MMVEHGKQAAYYAHASAGCLHIRPLLNLKSAADIAVMDAMQAELLALIRPLGGVLSGEHGDGLKLTHLNRALFGEAVTRAFAETKLAFDPDNLFNPGKKVGEEVLAEVREQRELEELGELVHSTHQTDPALLRYGPGYRTIELRAHFDWSVDGGLARAVEMCNGSGDCRKASGVMCPSFQATREEEHSTQRPGQPAARRPLRPAQRRAWTTLPSTKRWTCAWAAKPARPSAPPRWTWPRSRPRCWRSATPSRAHPSPRASSATSTASTAWPRPSRPWPTPPYAPVPARALLGKLVDLHPARALPPIAHPTFTAWFASRRLPPLTINRSPFTILHSPVRPLPRHLHHLQLPPDRHRRRPGAGGGQLQRATGPARLLRPAHAQPGAWSRTPAATLPGTWTCSIRWPRRGCRF